MNVNSALAAINSSNGLKQMVGIAMLDKASNLQSAQANIMLQDFKNAQSSVQAPHPYLGKQLDVSV